MSLYQHIIVGVDLHEECDQEVAVQAKAIAEKNKAKLTLVHAIEHLNAYGMMQAYPAVVELEDELVKQAKVALDKLCAKLKLTDCNTIVTTGSPKLVIIDTAKQLHADLIIVGSHGRHGLNLLLGSTANAVLHSAPCDVLTVRVTE